MVEIASTSCTGVVGGGLSHGWRGTGSLDDIVEGVVCRHQSTSLGLGLNQHVGTKCSFELIGVDHRRDHAPTTDEGRVPIRLRLVCMHHLDLARPVYLL